MAQPVRRAGDPHYRRGAAAPANPETARARSFIEQGQRVADARKREALVTPQRTAFLARALKAIGGR